jgi:hypothetical protein
MFLSIRIFVHLHYEHTGLILLNQNVTIRNVTQQELPGHER